MSKQLKTWLSQTLSAPVFADKDKTRSAKILNAILLLLLAVALTYSLIAPIVDPNPALALAANGGMSLLYVILLWLVRRGQVKFVSRLFSIVIWGLITMTTIMYGGINTPGIFNYFSGILLAGLLLGGRGAIGFAGLSMLSTSVILYAQINGNLPPSILPITPLITWWLANLNFVLSAMLLYFAHRHLNEALKQSRRNAQALRDSEERYRMLYNRSPIMMHSVDRAGRLVRVNDYWLEVMGYRPDEVIGHRTVEFLTEESRRQALETVMPQLFKTGVVQDIAYQFVKRNGAVIDVLVTATVYRDAQGNFSHSLAVIRDVTEQKRTEAALKEYSERLEERVVERTAELEAEIEGHQKTEDSLRRRVVELEVVAQVSTAASTILDSAQLLQTVVDLTKQRFNLSHAHIGLLDATSNSLRMVASADQIGHQIMVDSPVLYLDRDRSLATLAATTRQCVVVNDVSQEPNYLAHPLLQAVQSEMVVPMIVGERLIGVMAIQSDQLDRFSDEDVAIQKILAAQVAVAVQNARRFEELQQTILQLQETQEKLIRQEKLAVLGQLAGGIGHELRNPLGVISNSIYFLQMVLSDADETINEYLNLIADRVREADKIVADLLNLSRTRQADRSKVRPQRLVEEVLARCPASEKVTVATNLPADLPPLFIDSLQIQQVLTNLVTNAYQAMPNGGKLTIAAEVATRGAQQQGSESETSSLVSHPSPLAPQPPTIQLILIDTGHGMSPKILSKIFEPLYTTKAKGIGLGLAVSKNLVEINGGTLEVESTEDRGSRFIITLPIAH